MTTSLLRLPAAPLPHEAPRSLDRAEVWYERGERVDLGAVGVYVVVALATRLLPSSRAVATAVATVLALGTVATFAVGLAFAGWGLAVEVAGWARRARERPRSSAGRRWALVKGGAAGLGALGIGKVVTTASWWGCVQVGDVVARQVVMDATGLDPVNFPRALDTLTTFYATQIALAAPIIVSTLLFALAMMVAVLPTFPLLAVPSLRTRGRVAGALAWTVTAMLLSLVPLGLTDAVTTRVSPIQVLVLKDFSADQSCAIRGPSERVAHLTEPAGQVLIATPDAAARGGFRLRRDRCGP